LNFDIENPLSDLGVSNVVVLGVLKKQFRNLKNKSIWKFMRFVT